MRAKDLWSNAYCPWCKMTPDVGAVAEHVMSAEHQANVKKYQRSAAYRNRQGDLPFPPTLHDPPKLR